MGVDEREPIFPKTTQTITCARDEGRHRPPLHRLDSP